MDARIAAPVFAICAMLAAPGEARQVHYQPTPSPDVTAAREAWYLAGEPVALGDTLYFPAGAQIHFLPNEMVRSGVYRGIPLYTRTTLEPNSIVYVPVGGGLMQPYERRRDGELAGTVGSQAPSFPVAASGERAYRASPRPQPPARAAVDQPESTLGSVAARPGGTSGIAPVTRPAMRARQPGRSDGIFIEFQGARWFSAGAFPRLDRTALTRTAEHHGLPVYRRPGDPSIYVPISRARGAPLARYERR